jgi:3-polyprenyl-4-hydroxybenzoate decarboxylase
MVRSVNPDTLLGYLLPYHMASHYRHLVKVVLPMQQMYQDSLLKEITLRDAQVGDKNKEIARLVVVDSVNQMAIRAVTEQRDIYRKEYESEKRRKNGWKWAVLLGAPLAALGLILD